MRKTLVLGAVAIAAATIVVMVSRVRERAGDPAIDTAVAEQPDAAAGIEAMYGGSTAPGQQREDGRAVVAEPVAASVPGAAPVDAAGGAVTGGEAPAGLVDVHFGTAVDVEPMASPPVVSVELARTALRSVGKDRGAEAIWKRAINDPGLSPEVRSDLIEDLNDEGYSDPDALQAEDLPLILARLRLIEKLRPFAMDEVNAAAFEEAYMDLLGMLIEVRSRG